MQIVCRLYGLSKVNKVNDARYHLFTDKKKMPDPQKLPPSCNSLKLHLKRANYQTVKWKNSLRQYHEIVDPIGNGWKRSGNNQIDIEWNNQASAPDSLLNFVSCNCKKTKCQKGSCQCFKNEISCTDLCNCTRMSKL